MSGPTPAALVDIPMVRRHVVDRFSGYTEAERDALLAHAFATDAEVEAPAEYAPALAEAVGLLCIATKRHRTTCERNLTGASLPNAEAAIAMAVVLRADPRALFRYAEVVALVLGRLGWEASATNPALHPMFDAANAHDWPTLDHEPERHRAPENDHAGEAGAD